jgi:hypothetical protein
MKTIVLGIEDENNEAFLQELAKGLNQKYLKLYNILIINYL